MKTKITSAGPPIFVKIKYTACLTCDGTGQLNNPSITAGWLICRNCGGNGFIADGYEEY